MQILNSMPDLETKKKLKVSQAFADVTKGQFSLRWTNRQVILKKIQDA
jgi:hypothetical protein